MGHYHPHLLRYWYNDKLPVSYKYSSSTSQTFSSVFFPVTAPPTCSRAWIYSSQYLPHLILESINSHLTSSLMNCLLYGICGFQNTSHARLILTSKGTFSYIMQPRMLEMQAIFLIVLMSESVPCRSLYVWSRWYDRESNGWMLIPHQGPEKRVSQR